jgi:hypothetical protein
MSFEEALKSFGEQYEEQKPMSEDMIPPGSYQFVLGDIDFTAVEKDGDMIPMVIMKFSCVTPEYEKYTVTDFNRLNHPVAIGIFKDKLKILEIDPATPLGELEPPLREKIGALITGKIKHNVSGARTFVNITVNSFDGMDETFAQ